MFFFRKVVNFLEIHLKDFNFFFFEHSLGFTKNLFFCGHIFKDLQTNYRHYERTFLHRTFAIINLVFYILKHFFSKTTWNFQTKNYFFFCEHIVKDSQTNYRHYLRTFLQRTFPIIHLVC